MWVRVSWLIYVAIKSNSYGSSAERVVKLYINIISSYLHECSCQSGVGSVSSESSSVLHGRKDLTLSSNAAFTQSLTQQHVVSETDDLPLDLLIIYYLLPKKNVVWQVYPIAC